MKIFKISCGLVLLLSSCQINHEETGEQLVGSWAINPNHLFSYAEMYFHKDYTCFYFSLETGTTKLGKYRILGNRLLCKDIAVGKIRQIHEKKILLISDTGADTLYFIDDLVVDESMLKNDEAFRMFTDQFNHRREKFYLEKLGINLRKTTDDFQYLEEDRSN